MNEQRNLNTPYEPAANPEHDTSVGGLLRQLTREVPSLKKFEASSLKPDRTIHSLQKDKEIVRGHA